jgi:hypothetical protein
MVYLAVYAGHEKLARTTSELEVRDMLMDIAEKLMIMANHDYLFITVENIMTELAESFLSADDTIIDAGSVDTLADYESELESDFMDTNEPAIVAERGRRDSRIRRVRGRSNGR